MDYDLLSAVSIATVGASFPGSGTVECTARVQDVVDASFVSTSFTVSSGQNTGNPNTGFEFSPALSFAGVNVTVVCALEPGEGVSWVFAQ